MQDFVFRKKEPDDHDSIAHLSKALPDWFTSNGLKQINREVCEQPGFVAHLNGKLVGFLTYTWHIDRSEITWMGVCPQHHRQGIGHRLVDLLKERLAELEVEYVTVSTLGDAVDYEPYSKTRHFYRKYGFRDHQRIFHPENPECEEELILRLELKKGE